MIYAHERHSDNGWTSHKLAHTIFKKLEQQTVLVFSTTWTNENDLHVIDEWLAKDPSNSVICVSLFDPDFKFVAPVNDRIKVFNSRDFCFWLIATDKFFLHYDATTVNPTEFKYDFLCYQRKPYGYRQKLFNSLLDKKGCITIGNKTFDVNNDLPMHDGHNEIIGDLHVPNDIWSLGNITVWNQSFLNIVSETHQSVSCDYPFVSEKIFKPIIGMRPFICYGNMHTSEYLRSRGFETFDDDFNFAIQDTYDATAAEILKVVDNLSSVDKLYTKLLPKILHNANHFKTAAKKEWDKLEEWVLT
jgi:hypothetical protein